MTERQIWEGAPSQHSNLGTFIMCGVISAAALPWLPWLSLGALLFGAYQWLETANTSYALTSERLRITTGILNRRTDDVELFRVKDTALELPFLLRFFDLGNVEVLTSDPVTPAVYLEALPQPEQLRELIRHHAARCRKAHRVREVDLFTVGDLVEQ